MRGTAHSGVALKNLLWEVRREKQAAVARPARSQQRCLIGGSLVLVHEVFAESVIFLVADRAVVVRFLEVFELLT
jgi:hypothetical protein